MVNGQTMPVCSMVRLVLPRDERTAVETLPLPPPPSRSKKGSDCVLGIAEGRRGEPDGWEKIRQLPDNDTMAEIRASHVSTVTGRFRVCIDDTGHIESVVTLQSTGFAGYDRDVLGATKAWVYKPFLVDGQPMPVCTTLTYIYSQR